MRSRIPQLALGVFLLLLPVMAGSQTMTMPDVKAPAGTQTASASPAWPAADGTVVLDNFRFGTGETLPQLRLHYLTLGTPHRNAAGHVDNAVLLLHGTGGNAHSLLNPAVFERALRAGRAARHHEVLPHPARRHRPRPKFEALGRPARALSGLRLRRHGAQPAHDARRHEGRPSAADPGHVHGLHADLCVGRNVSRFC